MFELYKMGAGMMEKRKATSPGSGYWYSIDALRTIAVLSVVAIHTVPFEQIYPNFTFALTNIFGRFAVPFFFIVSGYLYALRLQAATSVWSVLRRRLSYLVSVYLLWSLVYRMYQIFVEGHRIFFARWAVKNFLINLFFNGIQYHLWYMAALIMAIVAITLYHRYLGDRRWPLVVIALILYGIGVMGDTYYGLFAKNPLIAWITRQLWTTRNGFFFGIPLFAAGYLVSFYPVERDRRRIYGLALVASLALLIVEAVTLEAKGIPKDYNIYLSLIPLSVSLLLVCLVNPHWMKDTVLTRLAKYSFGIYLVHLAPHMILSRFYSPRLHQNPWFELVYTPVVFLVSLGLTALLYHVPLTFLNRFVRQPRGRAVGGSAPGVNL